MGKLNDEFTKLVLGALHYGPKTATDIGEILDRSDCTITSSQIHSALRRLSSQKKIQIVGVVKDYKNRNINLWSINGPTVHNS